MLVDLKKNPDEIWARIQPLYEKWYKVKFKSRPSDEKIIWLYDQWLKFNQSVEKIFSSSPDARTLWK